MSKTGIIIYTIGLICYTIIISIRIGALIESQNKDTYSALIGWLMVLIYFIAYNFKEKYNK
jgi:purine-cytosine permease-like protein